MIIKVRSEGGPNLFIPIPTSLLCSRLTAGFSAKMMAQNGVNATPEQTSCPLLYGLQKMHFLNARKVGLRDS